MGRTYDDVPVIGVVTANFADNFGYFSGTPTPEEIGDRFREMDTDRNGLLDKTEIADGLRNLGRSERRIQLAIDSLPRDVDEFDLEAFSALLIPKARDYLTDVMGVPVPNPGKVLDIPVLGSSIGFVGGVLAAPIDYASRAGHQGAAPSDKELDKIFDSLDEQKTGKISKKEAAKALRARALTEHDIKTVLDSCQENDTMQKLEFRNACRFKSVLGSVADVPGVGPAFSTNIMGDHGHEDEHLKEAFYYVCRGCNKTKLDQTEVAEVLRLLHQTTLTIQRLIDSMGSDGVEELDFDGFKQLLEPKSRPYLANLEGLVVPNLAKVHDVPILGHATSFCQDSLVGVWDSTVGYFMKGKVSDEEIKDAFDKSADSEAPAKLTISQVAIALRHLRQTEEQIKQSCDQLKAAKKDFVTVDEFKNAVQGHGWDTPA